MGWWYIPGWRVVFKGLVASTKTPCSAPCLLNRAKLIWVCLGLLLSSLGRPAPLPRFFFFYSFPSQPKRLAVSLKDTLTGHLVVDAHTHILQRKEVLTFEPGTRLSKRLDEKPATSVQRSPSSCVCLRPSPHHHVSRWLPWWQNKQTSAWWCSCTP